MKTLILLRHAKSSWKDPDVDDHDRPLNKRGRKSAPVIARWLADRGYRPETALCSSAERARETYLLARAETPDLPEPGIERGLYHAEPASLRARLAKLDDAASTAMLVGHEPALGVLAYQLCNGEAEPHAGRAFDHFPTAAAAVLRFDVAGWSALAGSTGRLVDFAVARELMEN